MQRKSDAIGWFLFGIGSQLQVVASLSFTEIFVLLVAPILFLRGEYAQMRKSGVHTFFIVSLLVLGGCIINYLYFGASGYYALRRFAQVAIFVCAVPVSHWMIRRDMSCVKWLVLGSAISGVLCVFVFQKSVEVTMSGREYADIAGGAIFWIQRIGPFITAPIIGWYLQLPRAYSIAAPLAFAGYCAISSASGRSNALSLLGFAALVIIGGKKVRQIKRIHKIFWMLVVVAIISISLVTKAYSWLASNGTLGELARKKYESQSRGKSGVLSLLIGGRAESVIGIYACCHHPILGFGLDGRDPEGYWERFLSDYGTDEDIRGYLLTAERFAKMGFRLEDGGIPTHSYVGAFWTYYGIWGLIYWIYFGFVMLRYLKDDAYVIPQWYAWIACSMPAIFWNILFSPVSNRVGLPMILVACLYIRSIRLGKRRIPQRIAMEIERYAR